MPLQQPPQFCGAPDCGALQGQGFDTRGDHDRKGTGSGNDTGKPAVGEVVINAVEIVGLLPDPVGRDEGDEAVEIANGTAQPIDLAGWRLVDEAGNQYRLAGTGKGAATDRDDGVTMPLNNDGDTVMLIDPAGVLRSRVEYNAGEVRAGKWRPKSAAMSSSSPKARPPSGKTP